MTTDDERAQRAAAIAMLTKRLALPEGTPTIAAAQEALVAHSRLLRLVADDLIDPDVPYMHKRGQFALALQEQRALLIAVIEAAGVARDQHDAIDEAQRLLRGEDGV